MNISSAAEGSAISEFLARAPQPAIGAVGAFSVQLLEAIRERFYVPKEVPVFLDSAAGSLKLKAAIETLAESSRWPNLGVRFAGMALGRVRAENAMPVVLRGVLLSCCLMSVNQLIRE